MSLTKRQEQQLNRLARLRSDSELVLFEEVQDARDEVEEAKEKVEEVRNEAKEIVRDLREFVENHLKGDPGEPGDDGYTPIKGKDYFTDKEISTFKREVTPIKGKDYLTAKEITKIVDLATPVKGLDYLTEDEIEDLKKAITPKKGEDYFDGESPFTDTGEEIVQKINELDTNDDVFKIDASHIKNLPQNTGVGGMFSGIFSGKNGHTIFDETTELPQRPKLKITGSTVEATDDGANDQTVITISGVTLGGSDTQVQFNDGGSLGGDEHFTYDKTTDVLHVHKIAGDASDGLIVEASNGTDIGILGPGNSANVTWYGSHNYDAATQDTIAAFTGAGKTLSSLALATYPSLTELSYVKGVTSAVQTQLDARLSFVSASDTSSATPTPTAGAENNKYYVTALAEAATFGVPSGTPANGDMLIIRIKDNGTARALSWNAIYRASSDLGLPSTTVLSKTLYCGFMYNSADSKWDLLSVLNNF